MTVENPPEGMAAGRFGEVRGTSASRAGQGPRLTLDLPMGRRGRGEALPPGPRGKSVSQPSAVVEENAYPLGRAAARSKSGQGPAEEALSGTGSPPTSSGTGSDGLFSAKLVS